MCYAESEGVLTVYQLIKRNSSIFGINRSIFGRISASAVLEMLKVALGNITTEIDMFSVQCKIIYFVKPSCDYCDIASGGLIEFQEKILR